MARKNEETVREHDLDDDEDIVVERPRRGPNSRGTSTPVSTRTAEKSKVRYTVSKASEVNSRGYGGAVACAARSSA